MVGLFSGAGGSVFRVGDEPPKRSVGFGGSLEEEAADITEGMSHEERMAYSSDDKHTQGEYPMKVTLHDVEALRDAGKCLVCEIEGEEFLIPKSQIDDDSEVYKVGTSGDLILPEWLAKTMGLSE